MLLYAMDVILKLDFGGFRTWLDEGFTPPGDSLSGADKPGGTPSDAMMAKASKFAPAFASILVESPSTLSKQNKVAGRIEGFGPEQEPTCPEFLPRAYVEKENCVGNTSDTVVDARAETAKIQMDNALLKEVSTRLRVTCWLFHEALFPFREN